MFKFIFRLFLILVIASSVFVLSNKIDNEFAALSRINPLPYTKELIEQEQYAEAHEYLSFFMEYDYVKEDTSAIALLADIDETRSSWIYKLEKITDGVLDGKSDEIEGQVAALISDFLVIGDIRDIAIETSNWAEGEEVDELTLTLSAIGIAATAATWAAGSGAPARGGISFMKIANKTGKMPNWLRKKLIVSAKNIDKTKNLDEIKDVTESVYLLAKNTGLKGSLRILESTDDVNSLTRSAKYAKRFGKQSNTLLKINGPKVVDLAAGLKHIPNKTVLLSSTYGTQGLRLLKKTGQKVFLKNVSRMKFISRISKSIYKGQFTDIFNYVFTRLPNCVLFSVIAFSGFILLADILRMGKKAVKKN